MYIKSELDTSDELISKLQLENTELKSKLSKVKINTEKEKSNDDKLYRTVIRSKECALDMLQKQLEECLAGVYISMDMCVCVYIYGHVCVCIYVCVYYGLSMMV